jgi:isoleucyl-tRNA synthetase
MIQKEEFKRLGIFADWQDPYLTLNPDYQESILRALGELVKKGYVYRGLKPVNWCYKCETALAEAEVEYDDHTSASVYVKFKLEDSKDYPQDSYLVIWTTTPWTLMANVAVSVHPDLIYSYIKTEKGNLIIAKDLSASALAQMGLDKYSLVREVKGKDLEGLVYAHPFGLRNGRVVLAEYVSHQEGTGLVHTAPGHGNEDYFTGVKYKLDIIMPVDARGNFDDSCPDLKGINIFEANKIIINQLQGNGAVLYQGQLQHSYPHCWRCKNPVIFRATKQWFLNVEHAGLREKLIAAIKNNIQWIPEAGRERIAAMVELRPDWCLSRQRYWGVPIPALICRSCGEELLDPAVIENFAKMVVSEGASAWFSHDLVDFLPEGFQCRHCKSGQFLKGSDILDVWFDSGVSSQAVLKKRKGLEYPCALYLEGSDQHRGWFQSSLIPAMCIDGHAPFKSVLTHGFVVDGSGRKMSKSLGNVISPFDINKLYGSDILRMWVASSDYNEDIRISPEILSRLSEAYRKIRNTIRFILSNLFDFSPDNNKVSYEDLKNIDKWILVRLGGVLEGVSLAYERFEFNKAYKGIYDFCNEDLSMYYLDMAKGRLYTAAADSLERRAVQSAIFEVLNALVRMIAPILAFTAEEAWKIMPKEKGDAALASVHLLSWPKLELRSLETDLGLIIELIPDIAKLLEEERAKGAIGSSFDAQINILTNDPIRYKYLDSLKNDLLEIFKVSQVSIQERSMLDSGLILKDHPELAISVQKAKGNKCMRCWNYCLDVGHSKEHPLICAKCQEAIKGRESAN